MHRWRFLKLKRRRIRTRYDILKRNGEARGSSPRRRRGCASNRAGGAIAISAIFRVGSRPTAKSGRRVEQKGVGRKFSIDPWRCFEVRALRQHCGGGGAPRCLRRRRQQRDETDDRIVTMIPPLCNANCINASLSTEVELIPPRLLRRMCVLFLRPRLPGTAMRRGALASHRRKKDPSSVSSVSLCARNV